MNNDTIYPVTCNGGVTHDMIPADPAWVDQSGFPYGVLEWAQENMPPNSRDSKVFMGVYNRHPCVGEVERRNCNVVATLSWGVKSKVRITKDRFEITTPHGSWVEVEAWVRTLDPSGELVWVKSYQIKKEYIPSHINCPTNLIDLANALARALTVRWDHKQHGKAPDVLQWLNYRSNPVAGAVPHALMRAFYKYVNILDLEHPIDNNAKRFMSPKKFFNVLGAMMQEWPGLENAAAHVSVLCHTIEQADPDYHIQYLMSGNIHTPIHVDLDGAN